MLILFSLPKEMLSISSLVSMYLLGEEVFDKSFLADSGVPEFCGWKLN